MIDKFADNCKINHFPPKLSTKKYFKKYLAIFELQAKNTTSNRILII